MIKTKESSKLIDPAWPTLMKLDTPEISYVILATGVGSTVKHLKGVVVHVSRGDIQVGTVSNSFLDSDFKPYTGIITLQNAEQ